MVATASELVRAISHEFHRLTGMDWRWVALAAAMLIIYWFFQNPPWGRRDR